MELIVRTDEESVSELYLWIRDSLREVDPDATVIVKSIPQAGSMGAMEILGLVIPNAIALGGLVVSLMAYRESCERRVGEQPRIQIGTVENCILVGDEQEETLLRLRGTVPGVAELPGRPEALGDTPR